MFHENGMLRGQLLTVNDHLKTVEMELETSQDRVSKLAAEVDENKKNASSFAIDMDNMQLVCALSLRCDFSLLLVAAAAAAAAGL